MTTETVTEEKKPRSKRATALNEAGFKKAVSMQFDPSKLVIIGLDTKDGEEHYLWDPRVKLPLDGAMVENIKVHGVIDDIVVEYDKPNDRWLVVDGRRRVMHCREANQQLVAAGQTIWLVGAKAREGSEEDIMGAKESANRFRVTDDPIVTARNMQRQLERKVSIDRVALNFGCTDQTVRNHLSLLGLAPEVQEMMQRKWITSTAAMMLAPLDPDSQKELAQEIVAEQKETGKKVPVVEVARRAAQKKAKGPAEKKVLTPHQRGLKAMKLIEEVAVSDISHMTKEAAIGTLERICRIMTGRNLEQLAKALAREAAEEKKKG